MPEVERPKFRKDAKPTERSYGKSDSARRRDYCPFTMVVGIERFDATGGNPSGSRPIFSGDSTSPLTREASLVRGEG